MKRGIFIIVVFLNLLSVLKSQEVNTLNPELIIDRMETQLKIYPQEKLYLHLDRTSFFQGEDIWFKAYLTDAFLQPSETGSRYVYVELINLADSVVGRVMIIPQQGSFHGKLPVPDDLAEGFYTLRAYTRYMENMGEDSYFRRTLEVKSVLASQIRPHYVFDYSRSKDKMVVDLYYTIGVSDVKIKPDKLQMKNTRGIMQNIRMDKDTIAHLSYNLPLKDNERMIYLEADNFKHFIPIPVDVGDYDVSFYPEGGYLINGALTRVAFKATNSLGFSEEIQGTIFDSEGRNAMDIRTLHAGMGVFGLIAEESDTYYLECTNTRNIKKRFELPRSISGTCGLQAFSRSGNLYIALNSSKAGLSEDFYLLIHRGGEIYYLDEIRRKEQRKVFSWNFFPSGILQVMLLDKKMNPVSERLVFSPLKEDIDFIIKSDKDSYSTRDKVSLSLELIDYNGKPIISDMSVAVTDDKDVNVDDLQTITSTLLLSSELKGFIESPGFYFNSANEKAEHALDLLMMTQGWRRYDIPQVIKGNYTHPTYMAETGVTLSGRVSRVGSSKPIEKGEVTIMLTGTDGGTFFDQTLTNERGYFVFDRMEYPDSTKLFIQSLNVKGKDYVRLTMDEIQYAPLSQKDQFRVVREQKTLKPVEEPLEEMAILKKAEDRAKYDDNMQVINLKEVVVVGQDKSVKPGPVLSPYVSFHTTVIDFAAKMEKRVYNSVADVFYEIPGVQITTDQYGNKRLVIRGVSSINSGIYAQIMVDNVFTEDESILNTLNVHDVASIEVYKGADAAIFGFRGGTGVVNIMLKSGEERIHDIPSYNKYSTTALGFQKPVEFYSPKYDTPEQKSSYLPDLRTTIYWKPDIRTNEEGMVDLEFYTADIPSTYSVVIEGLTEDGQPIRKVEKIQVE